MRGLFHKAMFAFTIACIATSCCASETLHCRVLGPNPVSSVYAVNDGALEYHTPKNGPLVRMPILLNDGNNVVATGDATLPYAPAASAYAPAASVFFFDRKTGRAEWRWIPMGKSEGHIHAGNCVVSH